MEKFALIRKQNTFGHQGVLWCPDWLIGNMFDAADQVWTSGGDVCSFGVYCRY